MRFTSFSSIMIFNDFSIKRKNVFGVFDCHGRIQMKSKYDISESASNTTVNQISLKFFFQRTLFIGNQVVKFFLLNFIIQIHITLFIFTFNTKEFLINFYLKSIVGLFFFCFHCQYQMKFM